MTNQEFSNEFDILIQSYSSQPTFGITDNLAFTEYEKSVFLTRAQEELVIALYNGDNTNDISFEKTEEVRRYLSSLVKTKKLNQVQSDNAISKNSVFFTLPDDVWFITFESVELQSDNKCIDGKIVQVIPTQQDQVHRLRNNPFRGASDNRILRLDSDTNKIELISKYPIKEYIIRYLSRPLPIILEDLYDELVINNYNTKMECQLNPAFHKTILDKAVRMALISKSININKQQ